MKKQLFILLLITAFVSPSIQSADRAPGCCERFFACFKRRSAEAPIAPETQAASGVVDSEHEDQAPAGAGTGAGEASLEHNSPLIPLTMEEKKAVAALPVALRPTHKTKEGLPIIISTSRSPYQLRKETTQDEEERLVLFSHDTTNSLREMAVNSSCKLEAIPTERTKAIPAQTKHFVDLNLFIVIANILTTLNAYISVSEKPFLLTRNHIVGLKLRAALIHQTTGELSKNADGQIFIRGKHKSSNLAFVLFNHLIERDITLHGAPTVDNLPRYGITLSLS